MRDMYVKFGGQRYVLVYVTLALCTFLLWAHRLTSADFSMIVLGTVGVYIAGRTYQNTKMGKDIE